MLFFALVTFSTRRRRVRMRSRGPQGEDIGIDLVGFDLGGGNGLEPGGVCQAQVDVQVTEEIC
ncbi:MAG: hypothetical protein IH965_00755 [Gemmatimonadetes bacterium]|nr:hypothetical protein [Gemmatimonadota bacterium]